MFLCVLCRCLRCIDLGFAACETLRKNNDSPLYPLTGDLSQVATPFP